jgi:hypothetical protein
MSNLAKRRQSSSSEEEKVPSITSPLRRAQTIAVESLIPDKTSSTGKRDRDVPLENGNNSFYSADSVSVGSNIARVSNSGFSE